MDWVWVLLGVVLALSAVFLGGCWLVYQKHKK